MTGRAAGFCAGYGVPGFANFANGRGGGRSCGYGGRHGHRRQFHATGLTGWQRDAAGWFGGACPPAVTPSPEQAMAALQQQADRLETQLTAVRQRIAQLKGTNGN